MPYPRLVFLLDLVDGRSYIASHLSFKEKLLKFIVGKSGSLAKRPMIFGSGSVVGGFEDSISINAGK